MCERLTGARGLPAPAQDGRRQRPQRHRAAFSAGYERDTNGIPAAADGIRTGYESWRDRAAAGQVVCRYSRGRVRMSDLAPLLAPLRHVTPLFCAGLFGRIRTEYGRSPMGYDRIQVAYEYRAAPSNPSKIVRFEANKIHSVLSIARMAISHS